MGSEEKKGPLAVVAEQLAKPVYEDVAQPVAKEVGQSLAVAGSFVRLATRPFQTLALAGHLTFNWLDDALRKKFEGVPPEKIVEPPANVAGPLMLAAGFTTEEQSELRDIYAQLLASAMHKDTQARVHPAFVEIVKQLTPTEAVLLKALAADRRHAIITLAAKNDAGQAVRTGVRFTGITPSGVTSEGWEAEVIGVQNLQRLGVLEVDFEQSFVDETKYQTIRDGRILAEFLERLAKDGMDVVQVLGMIKVTDFGYVFLRSCQPPRAQPEVVRRPSTL